MAKVKTTLSIIGFFGLLLILTACDPNERTRIEENAETARLRAIQTEKTLREADRLHAQTERERLKLEKEIHRLQVTADLEIARIQSKALVDQARVEHGADIKRAQAEGFAMRMKALESGVTPIVALLALLMAVALLAFVVLHNVKSDADKKTNYLTHHQYQLYQIYIADPKELPLGLRKRVEWERKKHGL